MPFNCSLTFLSNNNDNNNTKQFRKLNWISVHLGPIIINIITEKKKENKFDVQLGTKLATPYLQSQPFNTWVILPFQVLLSDIPGIKGHTFKANLHVFCWVTQIFENDYSLAFKLV